MEIGSTPRLDDFGEKRGQPCPRKMCGHGCPRSSLFQLQQAPHRGKRFDWILVMDYLPASTSSGSRVLLPVIHEKDLVAFRAGDLFDHGIDFLVRLHGAVLVGINVAVEIGEERKITPNMS